MSAHTLLPAQYGSAESADFEANTWTFEMEAGYKIAAGPFAIVPRASYDKLLAALVIAREFISTDRTAFADTATNLDGTMADDDKAALGDYDEALLSMSAIIAEATGAAP